MSRTAEGLGYPQEPGWKEPTTSRDAAKAMKKHAVNLRELALAAIDASGWRGLTADETAAELNKSEPAIRPRLSELKLLGKIERTGERRWNKSGVSAAVWRVRSAP